MTKEEWSEILGNVCTNPEKWEKIRFEPAPKMSCTIYRITEAGLFWHYRPDRSESQVIRYWYFTPASQTEGLQMLSTVEPALKVSLCYIG